MDSRLANNPLARAPGSKGPAASGMPAFLGYVTSAYKVNSGRTAANPHANWEKRIAPRVRDRIVADLRGVDTALVPHGGHKLGAIKHFHSLAPAAQEHGLAIGSLRGHVNPGHYSTVDDAKDAFMALAREVVTRAGI